MKKFFIILGILFIAVFVILTGAFIYLKIAYPKVNPAPNLTIEITPQRLERGKYLANGFAGCIDCHSSRDWTKFSGPVIPGTEGMGGSDIGAVEGGGFVPASNITPDKETGIGNWTDGEIFRAITAGVNKNGDALAPMMPYLGFAQMDEEDIKSIIAYIKTLKPIYNKIPERKLDFPLSIIVRTIPQDPQFTKFPDTSDKVEVGKYYAGACFICHTPMEKGQPVMEMSYAGGREFSYSDGKVMRSANLTPDKETGIGSWSKQIFLDKFRKYKSRENLAFKPDEFNSIMSWHFFAQAKEDDLAAIYDFLMTLKPINNKVEMIGITGVK